MAISADYTGKQFGSFLIGNRIGGGAEAEVMACLHRPTGRAYALRLPLADDALWDGDPLIPPQNGSIEWANARGTWLATPAYYLRSLSELKKDPNAFKIATASIYGVLDQRYLVPVASPVRIKGVKDIDTVLNLAPANDLWLFGTWETLLGALIFEATKEDSESLAERWPLLVGGSILQSAAAQFMRGGTLAAEEQTTILHALSGQPEKPELAENLLLRICGCVERHRLSADEVRALFRCKHFRINVTHHDAEQMIQAYRLLRTNAMGADRELGLLGGILSLLEEEPADPFAEPALFEVRSEAPDPAKFPLLLQELASHHQPVITLEPS
ncbi:MAG: hypothetical protein JSS87_02900 [Acidobacteria bacterium]|nr:hypothetical protein [Acidobacteriota bacterium]